MSTFWKSLFYSEYAVLSQQAAQREQLEQLDGTDRVLAATNEALRDDLRALQNAARRDLGRVQTILGVLMDVLVEQGADRAALAARIETAIRDAEVPPAIAAHGPGGPFRGDSARPVKPREAGLCRQCWSAVEGSLPGDDVLCARCRE